MVTIESDDTEYEAKFYPVNKDAYRKKLNSIGATLVHKERKMRRSIVFDKKYDRIKCDYFRVRDEGDVIRMSVKTHAYPGGNLSDQKEIDVIVSDYDKTIRIIEALGFEFNVYQETLRETWDYNGAEITIDTWPGLDTYTEIEADSEEKVKHIALKLGFDWKSKIITSITEVYMTIYNMSRIEVNKKIKNITFENNPFFQLEPTDILD